MCNVCVCMYVLSFLVAFFKIYLFSHLLFVVVVDTWSWLDSVQTMPNVLIIIKNNAEF
jgi:hypothetical protein